MWKVLRASSNSTPLSIHIIIDISITSVATEEVFLPSEVEESIDVIDCDDRSVVGILARQNEGTVLEGHGGLEVKNFGGGNDGGDERASGIEGGSDHKEDGYVKDFRSTQRVRPTKIDSMDRVDPGAEKMKTQEVGDSENQVGDDLPLISHNIKGDDGVGMVGETTKETELILDAALIANEVVKESRKLNKSGLVFKIDFEKANDHVEWRFVDEVMNRKGFGDWWRS
ncbi:hypothetical protein L3X38_009763 [Prunus dulcis]|uniref:Uncharacterized protein n=1 Tax=Prunus dulcis TaxID=3755 RepID=A0AAD4ZE54_PRUDU|nr:hypothetical protein L3X38_009763 [Prunus dulcis]